MRQILFKAKRIDNGKWVEGWIVPTMNNTYHDGYMIIDIDGINYDEFDYWEPSFMSWEVDPNTICQYTGLTDKNGNKIWENDVIQYIDEDLAVNGVIRFGRHEQIVMLELGFYVEWVSNEAECFKTDICYWAERRDIEVIGNIFDNPELLKGE